MGAAAQTCVLETWAGEAGCRVPVLTGILMALGWLPSSTGALFPGLPGVRPAANIFPGDSVPFQSRKVVQTKDNWWQRLQVLSTAGRGHPTQVRCWKFKERAPWRCLRWTSSNSTSVYKLLPGQVTAVPLCRASPRFPLHQDVPRPRDVAVDLPSLKVRGSGSSLLAPRQGLPSGPVDRAPSPPPAPPQLGAAPLGRHRDCGGRPPSSCAGSRAASGDANLRPTSEEAISKTAITRKGNKSPRTSETFTHGEPGPCTVIRAVCLQSGIIYTEIFH